MTTNQISSKHKKALPKINYIIFGKKRYLQRRLIYFLLTISNVLAKPLACKNEL